MSEISNLRVEKHRIRKQHSLYSYFQDITVKSKNLYNVANYHIRQIFIAYHKEQMTMGQKSLIQNMNNEIDRYNEIRISKGKQPIPYCSKENSVLSYGFLDFYFKRHVDYQALPSHTSQGILKLLCRDWKSFLVGVKKYWRNPSQFTGKPKIPKYKKKVSTAIFSNQQCKIKHSKVIFPYTKEVIFTNVNDTSLREVRVKPQQGFYELELVYQKINTAVKKKVSERIVGIDLGVSNFATITTNRRDVTPLVVKGGILKSLNQFYNKQLALFKSTLDKKNKEKHWSKRLSLITNKRNRRMHDFLHKASRYVVNYCKKYEMDTLVVGNNKLWKQQVHMGKVNNQAFSHISFSRFISMLKYKCEDAGIQFIITEESYTSKASFIDHDSFHKTSITGKRVTRGLYQTKNGIRIHADVNGSYNIIRKAFPDFTYKKLSEGRDRGCIGLHPVRVNVLV